LLLRELRRGGFEVTHERVETHAAMSAALEERTWDAVISDYTMPHFSAPAALHLLREKGLDLPFIIVSGTIGEETAVAAMKAGTHDCIMKDNLRRLVPAIERELREADVRLARQRAEEALQKSEKPERKQQAASWKVFKSPDPAAQGNILYVFLIDPAVKGADYSVANILAEAFPPDEVNVLYTQYAGAYASGQNIVNLNIVQDLGK